MSVNQPLLCTQTFHPLDLYLPFAQFLKHLQLFAGFLFQFDRRSDQMQMHWLLPKKLQKPSRLHKQMKQTYANCQVYICSCLFCCALVADIIEIRLEGENLKMIFYIEEVSRGIKVRLCRSCGAVMDITNFMNICSFLLPVTNNTRTRKPKKVPRIQPDIIIRFKDEKSCSVYIK